MQQVARYARNREYSKGLNNVPCVVWSCIKMHAAHEIVNAERINNVPCVVWSCNKLHAAHEIVNAERINNVPCVVWSCNKLHATYEIVNIRKGEITFLAWFGRASRCTLRSMRHQMP